MPGQKTLTCAAGTDSLETLFHQQECKSREKQKCMEKPRQGKTAGKHRRKSIPGLQEAALELRMPVAC
jgi:hypothetical protein